MADPTPPQDQRGQIISFAELRAERDRALAEQAGKADPPPPADPPSAPPADTGGDGDRPQRRRSGGLPGGCPVTCLGTNDGVYYFLDSAGQLRVLKDKEVQRSQILSLFGDDIVWAYQHYPQYDKNGEPRPQTFNAAKLQQDLVRACASTGIWSRHAAVRGCGAWRGPDGALVWHAGDRLWTTGPVPGTRPLRRDCGVWQAGAGAGGRGRGRKAVYPVREPIPDPAEGEAVTVAAGQALLDILRRWYWARPELDPRLLLGWIAAGLIGGALDWRPILWLSGDTGTGKSTLDRLLAQVLDGMAIAVAGATEAALRQAQPDGTLPVLLDEFEADADGRKQDAIIKLLRRASAGATEIKGGADHQARTFVLRFALLASSIITPPLQAADQNRIAILDLQPIPPGAERPAVAADWLAALGPQLLRRLMDQWHRWPPTCAWYQAELGARGLSQRAQDTYGTLLAAADLLLSDRVPETAAADDMADWLEPLVALLTRGAGDQEVTSDWAACLSTLLTAPERKWQGGAQRPISQLIASVAFGADPMADDPEARLDALEIRARCRSLEGMGIKVIPAGKLRDEARRPIEAPSLAVAVQHTALAEIFAATHWRAGSGTAGGWAQALARVPGALAGRRNIQIGGRQAKAVVLPVAALDLGSVEDG